MLSGITRSHLQPDLLGISDSDLNLKKQAHTLLGSDFLILRELNFLPVTTKSKKAKSSGSDFNSALRTSRLCVRGDILLDALAGFDAQQLQALPERPGRRAT